MSTGAQVPRKCGSRFSVKDANPSAASSVKAVAAELTCSSARKASPESIACLAICTAMGARPAILSAKAWAASMTFDLGASWLATPQPRARSAVSGSPVKISSLARPVPIRSRSRPLPPQPGRAPMLTSVRPSVASSATIRRSHASANSKPPPYALPVTAATVGCRSPARRSNTRCPRRVQCAHMSRGCSALKRLMSAPAQNERSPTAVSRTTRTSRSESRAIRICSSCSSISGVRALCLWGRSRRIVLTSRSDSNWTRPISACSNWLMSGRRWGRGVKAVEQVVDALLADHGRGGHGVAADQLGHDRGVDHSEPFHAADLELFIDNGEIVVAHLAGADRVVVGFGPLLDVLPDVLVGLHVLGGQEFLEDEGLVCLAAHHLPTPPEAFQGLFPVVRVSEERGINRRRILRVRGAQ